MSDRIAIVAAVLVMFGGCGEANGPPGADPGFEQQPVEWYLVDLAPDERSLAIVYMMSGVASDCEREGPVDVEERENRVIVSTHKQVTVDHDRPCTQELAFHREELTLAEPLGERYLTGCHPGRTGAEDDDDCRSLERTRDAGVPVDS